MIWPQCVENFEVFVIVNTWKCVSYKICRHVYNMCSQKFHLFSFSLSLIIIIWLDKKNLAWVSCLFTLYGNYLPSQQMNPFLRSLTTKNFRLHLIVPILSYFSTSHSHHVSTGGRKLKCRKMRWPLVACCPYNVLQKSSTEFIVEGGGTWCVDTTNLSFLTK